MKQNCPCGGLQYSDCCQPYHMRKKIPDTAEQLMRSRYSGYALSRVDYLIDTCHPKLVNEVYRSSLELFTRKSTWLGLEIMSTSLGQKSDKIGKVKFKASYIYNGEQVEMIEHSRFRRRERKWVYYDDKG